MLESFSLRRFQSGKNSIPSRPWFWRYAKMSAGSERCVGRRQSCEAVGPVKSASTVGFRITRKRRNQFVSGTKRLSSAVNTTDSWQQWRKTKLRRREIQVSNLVLVLVVGIRQPCSTAFQIHSDPNRGRKQPHCVGRVPLSPSQAKCKSTTGPYFGGIEVVSAGIDDSCRPDSGKWPPDTLSPWPGSCFGHTIFARSKIASATPMPALAAATADRSYL